MTDNATAPLHTTVLLRLTCDAETKAYAERRRAAGKTNGEIPCCLERHLTRRVYKLLETPLDTYRSMTRVRAVLA